MIANEIACNHALEILKDGLGLLHATTLRARERSDEPGESEAGNEMRRRSAWLPPP